MEATRRYCVKHGILFNSYSPLGRPDNYDFRPLSSASTRTLLEDPTVVRIAAAHPGFSPAQLLLRWAWDKGVVVNPRSLDPQHMRQNLNIFDAGLALTSAETHALDNMPQDTCAKNPNGHECLAPGKPI